MRGAIVTRGKKVYLVVYLGVDPQTKKERRKWIPCADRKQADATRAVIATEPAFGSGVGPRGNSRYRLGDYLDQWLGTSVKLRCTEKEQQSRDAIVRLRINPRIGHVPLARLAPATIEEFLAGLGDTIDPWHAFKVLRVALNHAVDQGLILSNPCKHVDGPKQRQYEPMLWTPEEEARFLRTARERSENYPLWLTLIGTGIRPGGEILAVQWRKCDLDRGLIFIIQDLERPRGGGVRFDELKTRASRRAVWLPLEVIQELRAHHTRQAEERLRRGICPRGTACNRPRCAAWHDFDLIFCQPNGKPLHWHNVHRRDFKELLRAAHVPQIRPYDLRHLHLTMLAESGVSPDISRQRAGHSRASFTMDRYTHASQNAQVQATDAVSRRWASNGFLTDLPGTARTP